MHEAAVPLPKRYCVCGVCCVCDVSLSYKGDFIAFRPGINVSNALYIELYPHYIHPNNQQWSTPKLESIA